MVFRKRDSRGRQLGNRKHQNQTTTETFHYLANAVTHDPKCCTETRRRITEAKDLCQNLSNVLSCRKIILERKKKNAEIVVHIYEVHFRNFQSFFRRNIY